MPNSLHSSKVGPTQNFLPYGRYGNVATWHLQAKEPTRPIYGALNQVRISLTDRENSFLVCEAGFENVDESMDWATILAPLL
ncbi:hypothetical protein MRB53_031979 [Persea americana]|uniref:Uncharacterized protein n=1 Tax=Persea americana TaxID=3435 RepID=A0ACC2KR41_PERAE|nr:hypothetical protein MRB53_031979 [Persea americana]